jgi:hypothetical protein
LYSADEQAAVKELVIGKALEYAKAADIDVNKAMQLVRDNLIKIHHQQTVDHRVISGSDHGVRHVVQSNVAHTLNALDSERLSGLVSPKEKLMAMQIMIDHDLGYTLDAARGSLDASKDHPLASAAYLEFGKQNSSIFTDDDQKFMRDAVLKHSYPFGLDQPLDFANNKGQAIANIISIVDAMGVTANTKCPALYREVLDRAALGQLARSENPEALKQHLHSIINQAVTAGRISGEVAEGYHQALDYDVNQFGAKKMISPQFGGQLIETQMEQVEGGHALHITFGVSERIQHLATAFGDEVALNAFKKAGEDLFPQAAERHELESAAKEIEASPDPQVSQTFDNGANGAVKLTMKKL